MCPHCGADSPLVYRGLTAHCTACGGLRAPMSAPSVNLAGVPSKAGSTFTAVVGWFVLLIGLAWALGVGLLLWALFGVTAVALAFALPMTIVALGVGGTLLLVSRHLRRRASLRRREAYEEALLAFAWAGQLGSCTAEEAGRALGIPLLEADGILTSVAKREPDRLAMDVGDDGIIRYRPLGDLGGDRPSPLASRGGSFGRQVRVSDDVSRDRAEDADAAGEPDEIDDSAEDRTTRDRRRE